MPALYNNQVFPGGQEKTLVISATAGNVATNLSPGVGLRWVVLRGRLILVCDVTVANRYIRLSITDGTNVTEQLGTSAVVAATGTKTLNMGEIGWAGDGFLVGQGTGTDGYVGVRELILTGLDALNFFILSGVAGDSYTGRVIVREMAVE